MSFAELPVCRQVGRDKRAEEGVVRPTKERERREFMRQMAKDFREVMHIAGNREDFVKIVKAQVRLPSIIHGGECFLQQALFI